MGVLKVLIATDVFLGRMGLLAAVVAAAAAAVGRTFCAAASGGAFGSPLTWAPATLRRLNFVCSPSTRRPHP